MEATLNIVIDALLKLIMGGLGIVLFSLIKSRVYVMQTENVSLKKLHNDYKKPGLWSFSVIFILILILTIEPSANEILTTFAGLDLQNTTTGFLLLGILLSKSFDKQDIHKETSKIALEQAKNSEDEFKDLEDLENKS